MNPGSDNNLK